MISQAQTQYLAQHKKVHLSEIHTILKKVKTKCAPCVGIVSDVFTEINVCFTAPHI